MLNRRLVIISVATVVVTVRAIHRRTYALQLPHFCRRLRIIATRVRHSHRLCRHLAQITMAVHQLWCLVLVLRSGKQALSLILSVRMLPIMLRQIASVAVVQQERQE